MSKDFNVYKWRREQLVENEELTSPEANIAKEFTGKYSTQPNTMFSDRYDGSYRVQIYDKNSTLNMDNPESKMEVKEFFKSKGYDLFDITLDDRFKSWIWDFNFRRL